MFGTRHRTRVKPAHAGRYQFVCSCGARGYETDSSTRADQMGREHENSARK
ncbi:hypothetical protein ACF07S_10245 [Streptomyces sp. NPDC016640]|uniref:hypothetical protein n=1 Tax=Streptomyces sp. NPDC016640 TaxID=3364969 RepID=UPI0037018B2F